MTTPNETFPPLALVTGASSGIGVELARQFAGNGFDLILTAEDGGLDGVAEELRATGAKVATVQADLRRPEDVERLHAVIEGQDRALDAAALNAGVGRGGAFADIPLEDELEIIDLNVRSTVHLAKLLVDDMRAERHGRLLFTSSIASTMPGTYQAVYNASKSFVQSFAEALQEELKDEPITVTSLMPGPTDTNFFHRAQMDDTKVGQGAKDDPAQVARQGFDALMSGDKKLVAGSLKTKLTGKANSVLPDSAKAKLHRKMAEPQ